MSDWVGMAPCPIDLARRVSTDGANATVQPLSVVVGCIIHDSHRAPDVSAPMC